MVFNAHFTHFSEDNFLYVFFSSQFVAKLFIYNKCKYLAARLYAADFGLVFINIVDLKINE